MSKKPKRKKGKNPSQPRLGKTISFETAIFLFAFLSAISDKAAVGQMFMLALRGPDMLRNFLSNLAASQGLDLTPLMSGENISPASRAEVKELAEPFLKKGAETATFAQIADIYLFGRERTPENHVYAFYIAVRYYIARERKPTKEESALIWETTLNIVRGSKIGEPFWKKLEKEDPLRLEDWIKERKEDARKKYQTFLSQKRRAEATAEKAFRSLMSDTFGDEVEKTP